MFLRSVVRSVLQRSDPRLHLSRKWLRGDGLEVGALHCPQWIDTGRAKVRYVDIMTRDQAIARHPELAADQLVEPDIIDDGESLRTVAARSADFIIGNHFLEHTENPLGTIRAHAAKVRPGGVLFYTLPDKDHSFDRHRPITPFEHLVRDDVEGPEWSRMPHYLEYSEMVDGNEGEEIKKGAESLLAVDNRIHFHVWDRAALRDFFRRAADYLPSVTLRACRATRDEVIGIYTVDE